MVMLTKLLTSWKTLSRYQKARHLFRIEIAILLILLGMSTYNAPSVTGTFRAVQENFIIGVNGLAVLTTIAGTILFFYLKPSLLAFFLLSLPFLLYSFFNIQAIFLGYTTIPILALLNIILILFMLTVYWGYSEQ